jgi:hypothetical protein
MGNKAKILSCILVFVLGISMISAQAKGVQTAALMHNEEAQVVGGYSCAAMWGLELGLAAATLSPCGIICATAGWYLLMTLDSCS